MKFLNLSSDTLGRVPADPLLAAEGVVVAVGVLGRRPELKKNKGSSNLGNVEAPILQAHIAKICGLDLM